MHMVHRPIVHLPSSAFRPFHNHPSHPLHNHPDPATHPTGTRPAPPTPPHLSPPTPPIPSLHLLTPSLTPTCQPNLPHRWRAAAGGGGRGRGRGCRRARGGGSGGGGDGGAGGAGRRAASSSRWAWRGVLAVRSGGVRECKQSLGAGLAGLACVLLGASHCTECTHTPLLTQFLFSWLQAGGRRAARTRSSRKLETCRRSCAR